MSRIYIPPSGRMMVFVDGENMVLRYEAMLRKGREPTDDVIHEPEVFVWKKQAVSHQGHEILRSTIYTSLKGDKDRIRKIEKRIKELDFKPYSYSYKPTNLTPCVFKKDRKDRKAKIVDMRMTIDILHHVFNNNLDAIYLITGDRDYAPVIEETIRNGKNVFLAAFSNGLSPELPLLADKFIDLDKVFFSDS